MYNETGTKIKEVADNMVTFGILRGVGVGVVIFFAGMILSSFVGEKDSPLVVVAAFILSLIVAISMGVSAWRKHLLLAGFGELIESSSCSAKELAEIKQFLANKTSEKEIDITSPANIDEVVSSEE